MKSVVFDLIYDTDQGHAGLVPHVKGWKRRAQRVNLLVQNYILKASAPNLWRAIQRQNFQTCRWQLTWSL
jgi:hypothetical protein